MKGVVGGRTLRVYHHCDDLMTADGLIMDDRRLGFSRSGKCDFPLPGLVYCNCFQTSTRVFGYVSWPRCLPLFVL
jgi:hypothetical protein